MLFLKGLVDLHRIVQLQFLQHYWLGLDHHDIEWFSLETNRDHPVIRETASKYCFSDSLVEYEGLGSISVNKASGCNGIQLSYFKS